VRVPFFWQLFDSLFFTSVSKEFAQQKFYVREALKKDYEGVLEFLLIKLPQ